MQTYGDITYSAILTLENGEQFKYSSDNLDCTFSIERSLFIAGSTALITINNILPDDYNKFYAPRILYSQTLKGVLEFSLGRVGIGEYMVFKKDVYESLTTKEGQTFRTSFYCIAGQFALSKVQSIAQYKATLLEILTAFAENNNLEIGFLSINSDETFDFHLPSTSGMQALSTLRRAFPTVNIYIDNNKLYAINTNSFVDTVGDGPLTITSQQLQAPPSPEQNQPIIKIVTHLEPRIEINQPIKLESQALPQWNGTYIVQTVKHNGNVSFLGSSSGKTEVSLLALELVQGQ